MAILLPWGLSKVLGNMQESRIVILVDYSNLGLYKHKPIDNTVIAILSKVMRYVEATYVHCLVRFYGGWFTEEGQSDEGKDVFKRLQGHESFIEKQVGKNGQIVGVNVRIEMAGSILQKPEKDLFFTYRKKARTYDIQVKDKNDVACKHDSCLLPLLAKFLKTRRCPREGCLIDTDDLVWRSEQKLVDSMIVCDLLYCAGVQTDFIVLVSDDDDFVPPLLALSVTNVKNNIVRLSPKGQVGTRRFGYKIPNLINECL